MKSSPTQFQSPTSKTLHALVEILDSAGYADFTSSFSPLSVSLAAWQACSMEISSSLRSLVHLFLLGDRVAVDELPFHLREIVPSLVELGIIDIDKGLVATPGLSLLPVLGRWVFSQQTTNRPTLYMGDDSFALAHRLRPPMGGTALDLCSGPGLQALHIAGFSRRVVTVEVNPLSAALQRINVMMNGLASVVDTRIGDLYGPVRGLKFDFISANPPLLPMPKSLSYPFVGDGGSDGMAVVWQILRGLPEHLLPNGKAQIICSGLSDGTLPLAVDQLQEICREFCLDIVLCITGDIALDPCGTFVEELAATGVAHSEPELEMRRADLVQHFAESGASQMVFFFLTARRGGGRLQIVDPASSGMTGSMWYVSYNSKAKTRLVSGV